MSRSSSGCTSCRPSSNAADSPSRRTVSSSSACTFSTTSSMRAGWMRPSAIRRSMTCRATSRRNGSKLERMIAPGVSSTINSTPVACSSARMFRPSRPMIRPFMSSLGRSTTDTVVSMACSAALRWMASVMICRALAAACSRASASRRFTRCAASRLASYSICRTSSARAASVVSPAMRCSSRRASAWRSSACASRSRTCRSRAVAAAWRSRTSSWRRIRSCSRSSSAAVRSLA